MFISFVNDTGDKREKFWDIIFFIFCWCTLHLKIEFLLVFLFSGVDKLIKAGLSYYHRQCRWHRWTACRRCRWNYFKPKRRYLVLAASGASDQDVWGATLGGNFSWRFQLHHRRPCLTSAAGDITDLFPSTFSYPWQLPTSMAYLFFTPAINLSLVSLSPAIIVHRCRCHRR